MPAISAAPPIAILLIQLFVSVFLAILFLQSGIDKVVDCRGNVEWLRGHFAKSPFAGMVGPIFGVITILELAAGVMSAVGCALILFRHNNAIAFWGAVAAAISILALFFGQRVAKDYAGAAVLVPYFLVALVAMYVLAQ